MIIGRPGTPARVVLDANTIVSAVIGGARVPPAVVHRVVDAALGGASVVLVSPRLLDEVEEVLGRPRMRSFLDASDVPAVMAWLLTGAKLVEDPRDVDPVCRDPDDDYLVALARSHRATLVSGDGDLWALRDLPGLEVMTPREYVDTLR